MPQGHWLSQNEKGLCFWLRKGSQGGVFAYGYMLLVSLPDPSGEFHNLGHMGSSIESQQVTKQNKET